MDRNQDIRTLTTTFYYLNDLYDAADDKKINLGSRMIVDQFNNKFARLLYDYCMAVCLGEARHAQRICDKRIAELKQFDMDRHAVYNNACYFSEHSIISSCVEVFSRNWGYGSFGGNAWKIITETTGRYGTIPARLFIDFIIDLEHNSGCIFNKPLYFSYVSHDSYKALLDYKRNENIWENPYRSPLSVYKKFRSIFDDAVTLGIIERIPDWIYFVDDKPFPKAVEYGFVNLTVIDNDFTDRHDRDLYYCHRCHTNVDGRNFCHDSDHCKACCRYCQRKAKTANFTKKSATIAFHIASSQERRHNYHGKN